MRLVHYSAKPLGEIYSVKQEGNNRPFKPRGLWVSAETGGEDDHGWLDWCEMEQFAMENFEHAAEVFLREGANVLAIVGPEALLGFAEEYKRPRTWPYYDEIEWSKVAERYQGIIIAPYLWQLRLDDRTNWYYSWDCASGCIWDATAVERIQHLSEFRKPKREREEAA
jgi:hypothetical protein